MRKSTGIGLGAPLLLALTLAVGGALHLGQAIGAALAMVPASPADEGAPTATNCPQPPAALAKALLAREEQVKLQEDALRDREAAISLANAALDVRLEELSQAEESLRATVALVDSAAEDDLARLTRVYEAMKPADAAALFGSMAPEFAAGFLARMQPDAAAAIMSGLPPQAAYAISVVVAGRNARAPTE
ncbi:MotE family protein [Neotabrizicola shimadae]|uniref:Magnesium transporter MgtE intracellular domain-containing protein n=1 Tax=Neotabrizicola shimadae TaxID=2807096 RepID=A0A8G0ZXE1_9RHOB|nr:hypothetical protein [Neotabrizicola shimadae]QYZ69804.1 hypothetical protein JO391_19250 [Neotabrizicola shimadae]